MHTELSQGISKVVIIKHVELHAQQLRPDSTSESVSFCCAGVCRAAI